MWSLLIRTCRLVVFLFQVHTICWLFRVSKFGKFGKFCNPHWSNKVHLWYSNTQIESRRRPNQKFGKFEKKTLRTKKNSRFDRSGYKTNSIRSNRTRTGPIVQNPGPTHKSELRLKFVMKAQNCRPYNVNSTQHYQYTNRSAAISDSDWQFHQCKPVS